MASSHSILAESDLKDAVAYFLTQPEFVFDFEFMGENRGVPHLTALNWLAMKPNGAAVVIPFGHPIGSKQVGEHKEPRLCADGKIRNYTVPDWEPAPPQISPANVMDITRPLFFHPAIRKIGHGV